MLLSLPIYRAFRWLNKPWCYGCNHVISCILNVRVVVENCLRARDGYFGDYFPRCEAARDINIKISIRWAHYKESATTVHTLFWLWRQDWLCDAGDDVTIDKCDVRTCKVVPTSLFIHFVHHYTHSWSFKTVQYIIPCFAHYWSLWGSPVDSPYKGPVMQSFDVVLMSP